jgi:hypothetical protein
MSEERIPQIKITRSAWIAFRWIEVTELADSQPHFIQGSPRPIHEAKEAAEQYDEWLAAVLVSGSRKEKPAD